MFTKWALPLLAAAGLGFAIYAVVQARQAPPASQPLAEPPTRQASFARELAGNGLVEARRENVPIGATVAGVVAEVHVEVDQSVKKGDPLFTLDDRAARAELKVRETALAAAEAELTRIRNAPRPEDLPPAEAAVAEAQARLDDAEAALARTQQLFRREAGTRSEFDRDRFAALAARATLARAQADLDRLKKGSWVEDVRVAEARVAQAQAQVDAARTELDRLTTRAWVDGDILRVNVRPGQFAATLWNEPLIVMGDRKTLHVRVDIDEHDLPRFHPGARAVGTLRSRPETRFPLTFVRVEPFVIPKKSLTGDNSERVDTRVLQVIYALPDHRDIDVYVGQQMDVSLEVVEPTVAARR